ncbi:transposase [Limosilactobacillus fermentum]|nr:transposase [Limosilactobacillus fermentum]
MNQFNKDIIAALSSDKDITLNEVLRRQIEVAANQFLKLKWPLISSFKMN